MVGADLEEQPIGYLLAGAIQKILLGLKVAFRVWGLGFKVYSYRVRVDVALPVMVWTARSRAFWES